MQNQIGEIELHDPMQSRCEILKELIELSVGGNRFRNLQESLILAVQKIRLLLLDRVVLHDF
jgi:hypothetical protein